LEIGVFRCFGAVGEGEKLRNENDMTSGWGREVISRITVLRIWGFEELEEADEVETDGWIIARALVRI
jgi:hypothetical protein